VNYLLDALSAIDSEKVEKRASTSGSQGGG
jgi:hypothetical protein